LIFVPNKFDDISRLIRSKWGSLGFQTVIFHGFEKFS